VEDHRMGVTVALAVALTFPSGILSQAGAQAAETSSEQAAPKQTTTPQAQSAVAVPDLTGVWSRRPPPNRAPHYAYGLTEEEPPMQPWAEAKYKAARPSFGPRAVTDPQDPTFKCFPPGVPRIYFHPVPMEIIQIPGRVIMLFEYDHFVRQIYTDGRQHPKDMPATWMGDSIGRWEGDTLVVDTTGFNDKTWLDRAGHPHSDALRVVERFRRVERNTLQDDVTIDDPKAYTKPWGGQLIFQFEPDWTLMEMICTEGLESDGPKPSAAEKGKSSQ
jgi:hypothetical protein